MKTCLLALSLGSLLLAAAAPAETFTWKGNLADGKTLEIKGVNGSITAEPAAGNEIEVLADKTGSKSNPADVKIEVVPHADGVTICSVYPSSDGRPNECKPGNGGRSSVRDNDVKVAFRVKVPAGVLLTAKNVNGGITVQGLKSAVKASTVNGKVQVATAGMVTASTVNGSIEAQMGNANWTGKNSFETVNGGIDVVLPASASTEIEASTVNGSISTDFPLTISGKLSNKELRGRIGAGGRVLELETVNGSIKLRKS